MELLAEFTGRPSVGVELARLLDQPASAKPVLLVTGVGSVGKSAVAAAYAQAAGRLNRVRSVQRGIAELDQLPGRPF